MMGYDFGFDPFYNLSGGGGIVMFLGGLIFIGLIIFIVILFTSRPVDHHNNFNAGNTYSSNNADESLNILNMRYARGEISDEEYRKIKSTILNR